MLSIVIYGISDTGVGVIVESQGFESALSHLEGLLLEGEGGG